MKLPYKVTIDLLGQAGASLSNNQNDHLIDILLLIYGCNEFENFRNIYEKVIGEDLILSK